MNRIEGPILISCLVTARKLISSLAGRARNVLQESRNKEGSQEPDPLDSGEGGGPTTPGPLNSIPWKRVAQVGGIVALGATAAAPAAALAPVLGLAGFTATGPAAASLACAWHASIGVAQAGSLFSMLTSVGMAGAGATVGAPLLTAVGVSAGAGAAALGTGLVLDVVGSGGGTCKAEDVD